MRRRAANDRAETNHGIVFAALGHLLGNNRNLERARHPGDVDVILLRLVTMQRIERTAQELARDELIETRRHDADMKPLACNKTFDRFCHDYLSLILLYRCKTITHSRIIIP